MNNILRWMACAPVALAMNILAMALSPFLAALSMILGRDTLPGFLAWFHTLDNTLDGGQKDLGWPKVTGFKLWKQRTLWIIRNPAACFDTLILGIPAGDAVFTYIKGGPGQRGFRQRGYIFSRGKRYFFYRTNKIWLGWHHYGPGDTGYNKFQLSVRND